jgi:hypothetical protein
MQTELNRRFLTFTTEGQAVAALLPLLQTNAQHDRGYHV